MKKILSFIILFSLLSVTFSSDLITEEERIRLQQQAIDNIYEKAAYKSYEYFTKNGLSGGAGSLIVIHKNKSKVLAGLNYLTELYQHNDYSKALRETAYSEFVNFIEDQSISALSILIGPAKLYYESAKLLHAFILAIDESVYNTNIKTMAKKMINDPELFGGKDKTEERIINYYLKSEENNPNRDLVAVRGFFYEYGQKNLDEYGKKIIGWDDKSWNHESLHQQKQAAIHVVRRFINEYVKPAYEQRVKAEKNKKELEQKAETIKEIIKMMDEETNDSAIQSELNRLIEEKETEKKLADIKYTKIETKKPTSRTKEGKELERLEKEYNAKIKRLNDIEKDFYEQSKNWKLPGFSIPKITQIPYRNTLLWLNAEIEFIEKLNNISTAGLFNFYYSNLTDNSNYYKEPLEKYIDYLSTLQKNIEDKNNELSEIISFTKQTIGSISAVGYVGHSPFDNSIYNKKNSLLNSLNNRLTNYESLLNKNEHILTVIPEILEESSELQSNLKEYSKDIEYYNNKAKKLVSAYDEFHNFKVGKMDNLYALSREKERYYDVLENIFDECKRLFRESNVEFYFDTEYLNSKKMDTEFLDKAYDYYFATILNDAMSDIINNKELNITAADFPTMYNGSYPEQANYPLFKNRPYFMPQEEVNEKRETFENEIKDFKRNLQTELLLLKKVEKTWEKHATILDEFSTAYWLERKLPYPSITTFKNKYDNKINGFLNQKKTIENLIDKMDKRIKNDKATISKIDKEEAERFFKEKSRRRLEEAILLANRQNDLLKDCNQSERFFPIYLATDLGRAKTLYMYLYSQLSDADNRHTELEELFIVNNHPLYVNKITEQFNKETDDYIKIKSSVEKLGKALQQKFAYLDELQNNADLIDKNAPIIDIINGRLDSDKDGIPDNVELSLGTNPINPDDSSQGILNGTSTIPVGNTFDMSSGTLIGSWGANPGEIYYGSWSSGVLETGDYYRLSGSESIPSNPGAYTDQNIEGVLSKTGYIYALYWSGGYYGKIKILSVNAGNVTIEYWYNPHGGTF